jgi:hypothetical protein
MSTLRLETVTDVHLSVVVDAAANLTAQLSELNELREMVRTAELSAQEHAFGKKRPPTEAASFNSGAARAQVRAPLSSSPHTRNAPSGNRARYF